MKDVILKQINNFEKELFSDFLEGKLDDWQYEMLGHEMDMLKDRAKETGDVTVLRELMTIKTMYKEPEQDIKQQEPER